MAAAGGALYVADGGSHRVLKIDSGTLAVVAGSGVAGFAGDGGPATDATLSFPMDVAVAAGEILISDSKNRRVRRVDVAGSISTAALLTAQPRSLSIDGSGTVVVTTEAGAELLSLHNPTRRSTLAVGGVEQDRSRPSAAVFGGNGELLWASAGALLATPGDGTDRLLEAAPGLSLPLSVSGMTVGADGDLVMCDNLHHRILRVSAATLEAATAGLLGP